MRKGERERDRGIFLIVFNMIDLIKERERVRERARERERER